MMPEEHAHAATRPPFSTTADVLAQGRDNNFNLIRMLAASAVIISHSAPLSLGPNTIEPLHYAIAPLDLGNPAHLDALKRAYERFPEIGGRSTP